MTMMAGERINPGDLCVVRYGAIFRFRHETREEIAGVATAGADVGEPEPPFLTDSDAIMDALQIDFANRA